MSTVIARGPSNVRLRVLPGLKGPVGPEGTGAGQLSNATVPAIDGTTPPTGQIRYDTRRKGIILGDGAKLGGQIIVPPKSESLAAAINWKNGDSAAAWRALVTGVNSGQFSTIKNDVSAFLPPEGIVITASNASIAGDGRNIFAFASDGGSAIKLAAADGSVLGHNYLGGFTLIGPANPASAIGIEAKRCSQLTVDTHIYNFFRGVDLWKGNGQKWTGDICGASWTTQKVGSSLVYCHSDDPAEVPSELVFSGTNIKGQGSSVATSYLNSCFHLEMVDGLYIRAGHLGFAFGACVQITGAGANTRIFDVHADSQFDMAGYGWAVLGTDSSPYISGLSHVGGSITSPLNAAFYSAIPVDRLRLATEIWGAGANGVLMTGGGSDVQIGGSIQNFNTGGSSGASAINASGLDGFTIDALIKGRTDVTTYGVYLGTADNGEVNLNRIRGVTTKLAGTYATTVHTVGS